jgi:hypothetical protein
MEENLGVLAERTRSKIEGTYKVEGRSPRIKTKSRSATELDRTLRNRASWALSFKDPTLIIATQIVV